MAGFAYTRPHSIGVESRGGGVGGIYKSGEGGGPPNVGAIKGILTLQLDFFYPHSSHFEKFLRLKDKFYSALYTCKKQQQADYYVHTCIMFTEKIRPLNIFLLHCTPIE